MPCLLEIIIENQYLWNCFILFSFLPKSTTLAEIAGLSIDLSLSDLNSTRGYNTLLTSAVVSPLFLQHCLNPVSINRTFQSYFATRKPEITCFKTSLKGDGMKQSVITSSSKQVPNGKLLFLLKFVDRDISNKLLAERLACSLFISLKQRGLLMQPIAKLG